MTKIKLERIRKNDRVTVYPMFVVSSVDPFYNGTYDVYDNGKIIATKSVMNSIDIQEFSCEDDALNWCLKGHKFEIINE